MRKHSERLAVSSLHILMSSRKPMNDAYPMKNSISFIIKYSDSIQLTEAENERKILNYDLFLK